MDVMSLTAIDNTGKVKVFKNRLGNGITVVSIEQPHIHSMELAMFVRSGLRFENKRNNGIPILLNTCFSGETWHIRIRICLTANLRVLDVTFALLL